MAGQSAGRFMPRILPSSNWPPAMVAPVEPAVTRPAASSSDFSSLNALTSEDSFLRMASVGMSFMSMTSRQSIISTRDLSYSYFASSAPMTSALPASMRYSSLSASSAFTAPSTGAAGALSPPIASTMIFTILIPLELFRGRFKRAAAGLRKVFQYSRLPIVRGKGMTSLMLATPVRYIISLSKPRPKPECTQPP